MLLIITKIIYDTFSTNGEKIKAKINIQKSFLTIYYANANDHSVFHNLILS